jgi:nitroreductase
MTTQTNNRTAAHLIDPLFLERWSPRAFTDEEIPEATLMTLFEAARWAPSSFNSQPWRFLYARRGTPDWDRFLGLLNEFNQSWASRAAALVIVVSNSVMQPPGAAQPTPAYSHSFDTGAAWGQFALQATRLGWATHGMTGFDKERALAELNVPAGYRAEAAIAVGRRGDPASLPEKLRAREAPSGRLPLDEIVFQGGFPAPQESTPPKS